MTAIKAEPFCYSGACTADNSTVFLYHFEDGSGTTVTDSSGNGYDGLAPGIKWNSTIKKFNSYALDFNYTNVSVGNVGWVDLISYVDKIAGWSNGTIEFWIYPRQVPPASFTGYYLFDARGTGNQLTILIRPVGHSDAGKLIANDITTTDNISLNAWTHVAYVWNSTGGYLYINNALNGTGATLTIGTPTIMKIGTWTNSTIHRLNGIMDEFRLSNISRFLPKNTINLNASPSWNIIYPSLINISCAALEGATTLKKDGGTVSNPYTAILSSGTYVFTCETPETSNYSATTETNTLTVSEPGLNCTTAGTFAFSKVINITTVNVTLNFSYFVDAHYMKSDLSDVSYNSTLSAWSNGSLLIVNTTGISTLKVDFGNYIINNTYTANTGQMGTINNMSENYTIENNYYILNFYDEITGTKTLPQNATTRISIFCTSGSSTFGINDTTILLATSEKPTNIEAIVIYPSDSYYRNQLISYDIESKNFYLADAWNYTILQKDIVMDTVSYYSSKITLYKQLSGTSTMIITQGYFDIDRRFTSYLIKNHQYRIKIELGSETRDMGFIQPSSTSDTTLYMSALHPYPTVNLIAEHLVAGATIDNTTSSLLIQYSDGLGKTTSVRIRVYEEMNHTSFFDSTYPLVNNLSVTINSINTSKRYIVNFEVVHQTFGNSPVSWNVAAGAFGGFIDLAAAGVPQWMLGVASFVIMLFTALVTVPANRLIGMLLMSAEMLAFSWFGWFVIAGGALALIIVIMALGILAEFKKGANEQ